MNLNNIKKLILKEINKNHHFIVFGIRNQVEEFDGSIIKCYPSIFLIETSDNSIKSYSYNDYIIKRIIIK